MSFVVLTHHMRKYIQMAVIYSENIQWKTKIGHLVSGIVPRSLIHHVRDEVKRVFISQLTAIVSLQLKAFQLFYWRNRALAL